MSVIEVTTIDSLDELADQVLSLAADALADTAGGTPELVFNSVGPPPFDCCPMLAVQVTSLGSETMSPGAPAMATGRQASYGRLNLVGMTITTLRCAPTVRGSAMPTVAEMDAAVDLVRQDAWAVWNALYHAIKNGEFKDKCADVHLDRGLPIPEQGGCAGWQTQIRAELFGMPNPGP